MKLTPKYISFLKHEATVEVLEGTTFAGKTTVGVVKFMLKVAQSKHKYHILSGLDLGTIEKNIINSDHGITDIFGDAVSYHGSGAAGISLPHLKYITPSGIKIVYVLGYDNKARWKKALGGQYGCVYIDEANIADMEFVREVSIRYAYLMMTLNPDDPSLPIYSEYINRCRPLAQWEDQTPAEMREQLNEPAHEGWTHWYFTYDDNASITPEKREQLLSGTAKGTKLYKNKILGLRGRATGLIFNIEKQNIITYQQAKEFKYKTFTVGVDTAYSQNSNDTFAFVFSGITVCRKKITLACVEYNNRDLQTPITPSDIPVLLIQFLDSCRETWGFARDVFIDSADQATITECKKYKRVHGCIYNFVDAWKKTKIIDRINLMNGWIAHGDYLILDTCKELIREMNLYSWKEDKYEPEDRNDHTINADQYGWLPFKNNIGGKDNVAIG